MPPLTRLLLVDEGPSGRLYAFGSPDADDDLTRFLVREDGAVCDAEQRRACREDLVVQTCRGRCYRHDFRVRLQEYFHLGVHEGGFLDAFFARKNRYPFPVGALEAGRYRLYGVHYGPDLFIAGDGGLKLVPKIRDDAALLERFDRVRDAARRLDAAIRAYCGSDRALPRDAHGVRYVPDSLLTF